MTAPPIRLVTLHPGHFHAALVHQRMYPEVAPRLAVYGPAGAELVAHLQRLVGFNTRAADPTRWEIDVHASAGYLARFRQDRPGNAVVLAGFNADKIDRIEAALELGMHVLADKPWILVPADLPRLEAALAMAEAKGLAACDIMTERYEVTSALQRELVRDPAVFGQAEAGSPTDPGVLVESVHYLKKTVAGSPLRRPADFFDVRRQGEGLSDVGTHLVDLVMWILYPDQAMQPDDIALVAARRWPTVLSRAQFAAVTGEADFPADLGGELQQGSLPYYCNTQVDYTVRGVHVRLEVRWDYEAAAGAGDTHRAVFRGSRARVEVRQGPEEHFRPELYVYPASALDGPWVRQALEARLGQLQDRLAGVSALDLGSHFRVQVPAEYRVGHEAHFGEVTGQFLRYVLGRDRLPAWERPNMRAKYLVTTRGVAMARGE